MHNSIDKNRGAHGDSSFMLDGLLSSRENHMPLGRGNVMNQSCTNCWWHCHTDGRCYVDPHSAIDEDYALKIVMAQPCTDWRYDGLQEWEREDEDALVAMEVTK